MMETDQELIDLKRKRDELMERAIKLRDRLSQQREAAISKKRIINMKTTDEVLPQIPTPREIPQAERFPKQLNNVTKNMFGIKYEKVAKKWLRDDLWLYKSHVVMKTLSFELELTIDQKDDVNEVADILCHFLRQDASLLNEISPWVRSLTRTKSFSPLIFAFTQYDELSLFRNKVINKMVNAKFATARKCTEDGGGIFVYIHSPKSVLTHYAEFLWRLRLNHKTMSIEHCFVIECTDKDFGAANRDLIEEFCKRRLKKHELKILWTNLCTAARDYECN